MVCVGNGFSLTLSIDNLHMHEIAFPLPTRAGVVIHGFVGSGMMQVCAVL